MSLFVCPQCGIVENTALAVLVMDRDRMMIDRICSACGPAGWRRGLWATDAFECEQAEHRRGECEEG